MSTYFLAWQLQIQTKDPWLSPILKYITVALCNAVQRSYKLSKRDRLHFGSLDLIEFFSLLKARNKILYFMWFVFCPVLQMWSLLTLLALNPLHGPTGQILSLSLMKCARKLWSVEETYSFTWVLNCGMRDWAGTWFSVRSWHFIFGRLEGFSLWAEKSALTWNVTQPIDRESSVVP